MTLKMNDTDELVTALRRAAHSLLNDSNIRDREPLLADVVATAVRTFGESTTWTAIPS